MRSSSFRVVPSSLTLLFMSSVAGAQNAPPSSAPPSEQAAVKKKPEETPDGAQGTASPETTAPETTAPETTAPETTAPETTAPETTAPETTPSEASASESSPTEEGSMGEAAPGDAPPEEQAAPVEDAPPPTETTAPAEESAHSASANQATPPPADDYAGASDAALVEPKKKDPNDLSLNIGLDLTWPLGKAANFIDSASIQGLSLDLRYYFWKNIGLGAGVAFDGVSKKTSGTVAWQNTTITGNQLREISFTPITLKGIYAWRQQEQIIPYVAAGAGVARTVRRLEAGYTLLSDPSWHFVLVPEVGLNIPAGPTIIQTNVRLAYLPAAGGTDEQMFANFSFGLAIQ